MTYRLLDLFSGIGGFSLGLERSGGFKTVAFCAVEPFCTQMMSAGKIYRKEDIQRMSNQQVNAGFGPRGAATYDIWLYKGGANCHHRWNKQVYATFSGKALNVGSKELKQVAVRKAVVERQQAEERKAAQERQQFFQSKFESYSTRKSEVAGKLKDFEDVEGSVKDTLNETQLGVVLAHAKDPALLLYAIGKDEKRLQELAKISDPVEYIFAVARMETQLRTSSRKPSSVPEKSVKGSATTMGSDKRMDQLIAEAQRTGDGTKLRQYRASLKQKK